MGVQRGPDCRLDVEMTEYRDAQPFLREAPRTLRPAAGGQAMKQLGRIVLGALPWGVIAALLVAAFYLEPAAVEDAVQPAPVSDKDRFYGVAHANPDAFWLAGNLGKIAFSDDGGRSWVEQDTPVADSLQSIAAWDHETLVAVGDGGVVLRTDDAGATWELVEVPVSEIADKLIRVRILADGSAWVVGEFGTVLVSHDRGRTWRDAVEKDEDVTWHDVAGDGERVLVVGEFGRMMASGDGGQTWSTVDSPVESTINAVAFRDATHGVAVGLQGRVLVTADGGETWETLPPISDEHLFEVVYSEGRWLAVGDNGLVARARMEARDWRVGRVSDRDYGWHTGIAVAGDAWFLAGKSNGLYDGEHWRPIADGRQRQEIDS